jgi:hypothetical protein
MKPEKKAIPDRGKQDFELFVYLQDIKKPTR